MSDEDQAISRATKKPARKPRAPARPRTKAKDAATGETVASPRAPVSVPEVPAPPPASRRASAVRLGILTTTLAAMIGGLAWVNEVPDLSRSGPLRIAFSPFEAEPAPRDPLTPQVRQSIEQDLRLAAIALQIRENQESLSRLWEDARTLAASVGSLASGVEALTDDVDKARADAVARLARVENRLRGIEVATAPEPIPLGDPALLEVTRLGHPQYADRESTIAQTGQPATTGGLPDLPAPPQATVTVNFAKKVRKAPKPIGGWVLHTVQDDLALVEGEGARYEVRTGEELPGAGIVRAIKKRGEQWVVLTSKGVISEPK
jgi:hypothetical protein